MSPTLPPDLLAELRGRIEAAALSSHADAIVAAARPAIELILDGPSDKTIGETRFGGAPDLPADTPWPRDRRNQLLTFLLQINLSEIPPFEGNPWPARGWLSVFLGSDESLNDIEHHLILTDGDATLAPRVAPEDAEWAEEDFDDMAPHRVRLQLRADVPHYGTRAFDDLAQQLAPSEDDVDDINDALMALTSNAVTGTTTPYIGQIAGYSYGLSADPSEIAFMAREVNPELWRDRESKNSLDVTPARNWVSLLHLESIFAPDLNFCIWDAGFLSFMIQRDDLSKLDFSRVYVGGESS